MTPIIHSQPFIGATNSRWQANALPVRTALPAEHFQDAFTSTIHFGLQKNEGNQFLRFNKDGKLVPAQSHLNDITSSDVESYLMDNFGGDNILPEDQEVMEKLIQALTDGGLLDLLKRRFGKDIEAGKPLLMSNIGHADLYPPLLLKGIANALDTENYKIDLVDPIRASSDMMHRSLYGTQPTDIPFQEMMWNKFQSFMHQKSRFWDGSFDELRQHSQIIRDGTENIPKERYHVAFLSFPKTISDSECEFQQAIQAHVDSVKTGGLVAGVMMINSLEWKMGNYWQPELLPLTKHLVEEAFRKAGVYITVTKLDAPPQIRDGYDGIMVYTGIKL